MWWCIAITDYGLKDQQEPRHNASVEGFTFFTVIFNINLKVMLLAGILNVVADSISRNNFPMQSIQFSQQPTPDPIPSLLWQLLVTERPDWTYVNQRELLRTPAKQD